MDFSKKFSEVSGIGDAAYSSNTTSPIQVPSEDVLSTMSFSELEDVRKSNHGNLEAQNKLAPYNHRALIRELWQEGVGGAIAASAVTVAAPVYEGLKALDVLPKDVDTSEPQIQSVKQAFIGFGEGLKSLFSLDNGEPIKREVSPEVTRHFEIKKQVEELLPNLIKTESGGRHTDKEGNIITGVTGDKGVTQIRPKTGQTPGYGVKPIQNDTEEEYIRFSKDYLQKMIQVFDDTEQGIAAYNAGPGRIHRAVSKANRTGRDWKEFIPATTREYIKRVKG